MSIPNRQRDNRLPPAIVLPAVAWMFVGLVMPLMALIIASFLTRGPFGQIEYSLTTENYRRLFDSILIWPIVRSTLFAISSTLLCILIALPVSGFIATRERKFRGLWLFLVVLPFWASFLIRVFAWVILLRGDGIVSQLLLWLGITNDSMEVLYSPKGVIIGLVYVYVPFMILPIYSSIEKLNFTLVRAASDLGANAVQIFWNIVWPLIRPGVRAGILFVFVMSFGDFVVADLLGGSRYSMIGNVIKDQFLSARNWPFGSALSVAVVTSALILLKVFFDILLPHTKLGGNSETV